MGGESGRIDNGLGLLVEHFHEIASNDFTLLLWIVHSCEVGEELLTGIDADDVKAEDLVILHHLLELVLAEHAVVYEDASESVADGAVQQYGGHGGVYPTRQAEDHLILS